MTPKQEAAIRKHGEQLNAIFHTGLDPVVLCKKLRRIEGAAHRLAEDACNYLRMESPEYYTRYEKIVKRLADVFTFYTQGPRLHTEHMRIMKMYGIFINMDPRGYALKIDNQYMREHNLQLHRDMGGYGILAPEFNKEGR
jgi:hypothetical protein